MGVGKGWRWHVVVWWVGGWVSDIRGGVVVGVRHAALTVLLPQTGASGWQATWQGQHTEQRRRVRLHAAQLAHLRVQDVVHSHHVILLAHNAATHAAQLLQAITSHSTHK